jgi:hypothetical protein
VQRDGDGCRRKAPRGFRVDCHHGLKPRDGGEPGAAYDGDANGF